jgi:hypothetical protein
MTKEEQVQEILEWIKLEKAKPFPDQAALKQAVADIREIKDDYRVVNHAGQYGNQKRCFLDD